MTGRRKTSRLSMNYQFTESVQKDMGGILKIQLNRVEKRLKEKEIKLSYSPESLELLALKGYDQDFGAKPLKHFIHQKVSIPLSKAILAGQSQYGSRVELATDDNEITFMKKTSRNLEEITV